MAKIAFRPLILALSFAAMAGCVDLAERDTFQDKRIELKRRGMECGADTACMQKNGAPNPKASAGKSQEAKT